MNLFERYKPIIMLAAIQLCNVLFVCSLYAIQDEIKNEESLSSTPIGEKSPVQAPDKVVVNPVAQDIEIQKRLQRVIDATGWFNNPRVKVDEGIVLLSGQVKSDELKKWAENLARKTQDVVAVINQISVLEPDIWDFGPAKEGLSELWRDFIHAIPFIGFGFLTLILFIGLGLLATFGLRKFLKKRIRSRLLQKVIARGFGVVIVLIGMYLVLRVSGLTQLALTIIGGTGLMGLVLGIAFRDISENFLASIFLSLQNPFKMGDLIEVAGITGFVQELNLRTTILITPEGTFVQIPNASVYKSNLRNFTTNCNRREEFIVGIGYENSINRAQEIARKVMANHPAVLNDPEPWVLADNMSASTIDLRIYFWLNGCEHSWLKVRSSVIRLIKLAFQEHGISMPDSDRELYFPEGIIVTMSERSENIKYKSALAKPALRKEEEDLEAVSTNAEAGLSSEAKSIEEQAGKVPMKNESNLLRDTSTK